MAAKPLRGRLAFYSTSFHVVESTGNSWLISAGTSRVGHANRWPPAPPLLPRVFVSVHLLWRLVRHLNVLAVPAILPAVACAVFAKVAVDGAEIPATVFWACPGISAGALLQ